MYIGRRVEKGGWSLPQSDWQNPFTMTCGGTARTCWLYESYLRTNRPDLLSRLSELDGKVLGCWCKPEPCHGDVLIKLLNEQKALKIAHELEKSGLDLVIDDYAYGLATTTLWAAHPLWLAYATRLATTNIYYFTPDMYHTLCKITHRTPLYWEAVSSSAMRLYIVGVYFGTQPMTPLWGSELTLPSDTPDTIKRLITFGQLAQKDIELRGDLWSECVRQSVNYLTLHRTCVRECGHVLNIDMFDHDLTKTRIVQIALGFMWHWDVDEVRNKKLMALAVAAIKAGHLEQEDHHPEFTGVLGLDKMFVDRVAVHLQKDPLDDANGWDLNPCFIPETYKGQWEAFRKAHQHLDMYDLAYYPALAACNYI